MSKLSRGLKNASYLTIGNLATQVISIFGFIYIARMLGPKDYGIYTTVGAFVGFFQIFTLVGLNKVVLREGSKDVASMNLYLQRTVGLRNLLISIAIVVCIICSFFTPYEFQTKLYIVLFSSELVFVGLNGFIGTIFQANEKMQYISIFNIANGLLYVLLSIGFLYCGFGLLTLFLIALFVHLLILVVSYRVSQKFITFDFFSKIKLSKDLLKPAISFSLLSFLGLLTTKIDLLMISFLGRPEDVGVYGVAYRIAREGVLLRNVTATAFFPIAVKVFHKGKMKSLKLVQYSFFFLVLIFILSLVASLYIKDIITFVFGPDYSRAGHILTVLLLYLGFSWMRLPFTTALQATHNENVALWPTSIMAGLNILLNYLFFLRYGLIGIAYSTLVVESVGSILFCILGQSVLKRQGHLVS